MVLDSSVLIAAIAHPGVCTELLEEEVQDHFLIAVDKDLLFLREFQGIPIVRPGDFWKRTRTPSKA